MMNVNFTADELNSTYQESIRPAYNVKPSRVASISAFHAGLNIFLSITALLGNALILVALHKVSSLHPPTKLLFRCLAVTDLCVGLISQPLHVIDIVARIIRISWKIVYHAHKLERNLGFVLCGLSISVSTAISVDRLLALLLGLRYKNVETLGRVRALIIVSFLLIAVSIGVMDTFVKHRILATVGLVFYTVCLVISVFSYTRIFLRLRQQQVQVQGMRNVSNQAQPNGGGLGIPMNIARYKKTVSSIAWVQLALVACYFPYGIVATFWVSGIYTDMARRFAVTLVYLNSSLNPFLYCWKIRDVRQAAKNIIRQFCGLSS